MDANTGEACPPTAQHAVREGRCAAENIAATLRGTARRAFALTALGKMGLLGHRSAVAEVFGLKLSGFLAWWLWRTVYLMKLPGLDRKIRVAVDWTLDLLLPSDIVQLRTDRAVSIRREHFEAGQAIFREGDHGDWLYIIEEGEVEVRKQVAGEGEVPIRRLGPGDCFGEIALLGDHVRTASTHSLTSADVLAIDRDACQALLSTLPPLRDFFNRLVEERVGMRPESRADGHAMELAERPQ